MKEILTQLFGEALTDDALKQINSEIGKKFVAKSDYNAKLDEIKELKAGNQELEHKITELNTAAGDAEDFKVKFEELQKEITEREEKAIAERAAKEKAEAITKRFNAALGDKKFNHEAIRADYEKKFSEALESKEFEGKSDVDIFHELTKDDGAAFAGVKAFKLEGAKPMSGAEGKIEIPKIF